jgi:hypothetical protein
MRRPLFVGPVVTSHQGRPRVEPHVDGELGPAPLAVETIGDLQQRERRVGRCMCVQAWIGGFEDGHEAIAGGLVDVSAGLVNRVQERREVALHQRIERIR